MSFCCKLNLTPSSQTLSNAFDISKNTLLTSISLSKHSHILWGIDKSWLTHKSPDLKPDRFGKINLLSIKKVSTPLYIDFSIVFLHSVWEERKLADSFQCFE